MATTGGWTFSALASMDASTAVIQGGAAVTSAKDLGAAPTADFVLQFSLSTGGTANIGAQKAYVEFCDDNATWPESDSGNAVQGDLVYTFKPASGGDGVTLSKLVAVTAKARYVRCHLVNDGLTDTYTWSVDVATKAPYSV